MAEDARMSYGLKLRSELGGEGKKNNLMSPILLIYFQLLNYQIHYRLILLELRKLGKNEHIYRKLFCPSK